MLRSVLCCLCENCDWALTTMMVLAGAWNFWFQGPALAERGFRREARLAACGGLVMLVGALALFLVLQIACAYLGL